VIRVQMEDRAEEDEREDEHEGEDENKQLLAHSSDAGGRTRASGRWCALGLLLALLAVACAAFTAWRPPASAPTLPNPASAGVLEYAAWPRPQTELATETLTALGLDRPFEFKAGFDGRKVAARMLTEWTRRAETQGVNATPPVLVVAQGPGYGLGNVFAGLTAAAVLAEAIGGACVVALAHKNSYAVELSAYLRERRMFAFPCVVVTAAQLADLKTQKLVPVVFHSTWRLLGPGTEGPFMIDFSTRYREERCLPRPDLSLLLVPPGMAPPAFWQRLRSKFEEWLHAALDLPTEVHEHFIDAHQPWALGEGTLCGHARLMHFETHHGRRKTGIARAGALRASVWQLLPRVGRQLFALYATRCSWVVRERCAD